MASQRTLAAIVAGVAGILGLTVLIVVLAGQRAPVDYAPDSPEAAVQAYLRAWDEGDPAAAYSSWRFVEPLVWLDPAPVEEPGAY